MEKDKMLEAITNVINRKRYDLDSLNTSETDPAYDIMNGSLKRTISITFTEILQQEDIEAARKNDGKFVPIYHEICEEYNRLTAYDFDVKTTKKVVSVTASWIEPKKREYEK